MPGRPAIAALLGALLALGAALAGPASDRAAAAPSLTSGWRPQSVPALNGRPPLLYSIYAYDAQTLWAAGAQGPSNVALYAEILKSSDGGRSWTIQYAPQICCEILQIVADSPQRVTALQSRPSGARLLTSYDGGATWLTQYRDDSIASSRLIGAITAASPTEAWAASSGQILHTSTGGLDSVRSYLPFVPR